MDTILFARAEVAELADALRSGRSSERSEGSNPLPSAACPDGETEIMPRFERGGPGSTPGRAAEFQHTSVLLGEPAASKTASRGSTPRARAFRRRGSTEKGARFVSGLMLVRIQSSALATKPFPQ